MALRPHTALLVLLSACGGYADVSDAECARTSSERIADILAGEPDVAVPCATVTFVRSAYEADVDGLFVQAEPAGPALYIDVPFDTLREDFDFTPAQGQLIGMRVDGTIETESDVRRVVTGLSDIAVLGESPTSVEAFVTNHTGNPDLYEDRRALDFTLAFSAGRIESFFGDSGDGFQAANFNSLADQGEENPWVVSVKARFPREVIDKFGLVSSCWVDMGPTPLWPQSGSTGDRLHFTRWEDDQVEIHSCPNGTAVLTRADDDWVEARLQVPDLGVVSLVITDPARWWSPDLSDPSLFQIDGIPATELVNDGPVLRLRVPGLPPDSPLQLVLPERVEDILGHRVLAE